MDWWCQINKKSIFFVFVSISILIGVGLFSPYSLTFNSLPKVNITSFKTSQYCENQPVVYNSSNVVGYWKLNELTGLNTYDSSGNGYNGTIVNMDESNRVSGKLNNCLSFNGVDEYVNLTNKVGNFTALDAFSIEFWINPDYNYPQYSTIISKYQGNLGWMSYLYAGYIWFGFFKSGGFRVSYSLGVSTNEWNHVVLTTDGSGTPFGIEIYIDGVDTSEFRLGFGTLPLLVFTAPVRIGAGQAYYQGFIDNVIIYNRTLTHSEVISQYNNGFGYEGYPDGYDPILENLTISENPIELTLNEIGFPVSICVDACDYSGIDYVYLIINNGNYTMSYVGNNTYCFNDFQPSYSGLYKFTIWCKDMRINEISITGSIAVLSSAEMIGGMVILVLVFLAHLLLYLKLANNLIVKLPLIASLFLLSIGINIGSFGLRIPLTPFIQILFIVLEGVIMLIASVEYYEVKRGK